MPRQATVPVYRQLVSTSTTFSTSAGTSNVTSSLKGTANALPLADAYTLFLDVQTFTANTSVGGLTLDVFVDSSPDGGTTWYPSLHFGQVTASTSIQRMEVRPLGIGPTEVAALQNLGATISTTSAGTTTNTVIAADHRVRVFMVGSGATCTLNLWALALPFATYGN